MSKAIEIDIDEASLRAFYRRIDPNGLIRDPIESFYIRVADSIEQKAKHNAPKDTGELADSIKHKKIRNGRAVIVGARYGVFVHEGTKPHFPPPEALRGWAERRGLNPYAVAHGIAKRGTRPQPFLRTAVEQTYASLPIELQRTVAAIERHFGGGF